jgi:hypothetical protein
VNSLGRLFLEIADQEGFDRTHPCFFRLFSFRRERREALLSVAIMRLRSVVKSEAENVMEAETSILVNGGSSLYDGEELAW